MGMIAQRLFVLWSFLGRHLVHLGLVQFLEIRNEVVTVNFK